jgi:hypothetical protein
MYGYKDSGRLVTLWVRKKYCDVGIENVYAFGAERLRKVEAIGKASPEHFRLHWAKDYATKEASKWGAERDGKFLEAATFDGIESLSAAQQVGPAVLHLAEFLDEYWTWYEQNDVDSLDIWQELAQ